MKLEFKKGDRIVFDGDSLTNRRRRPDLWPWPFLQLMHWDRCWSDIMSQLLFCWRSELELTFFNTAIGGLKSDDILERLESEVLPLKPNWVLLTVGGNDCNEETPLKNFQKNIIQYCERLKNIDAKVVFFRMAWASPDMPELKKKSKKRKQFFYHFQKTVNEISNAVYVDITKGYRKNAEAILKQHKDHQLASDGEHYNNIAATIFAGEALKAFGIVH